MIEMFTITLLVWNVHGLPFPALTGGAKPKHIEAALNELKNEIKFDVLLAQEVWTKKMYRALKRAAAPNKFVARHKRAGLVAISDIPKTGGYKEYKFKYTTMSKWDFLSKKGFQVFYGPNNVMFINTHLDSNGDIASQRARQTQVVHILEIANEHNGPIVLAGDLNLKLNSNRRKIDEVFLSLLLQELNLKIALRGSVDYILVSKNVDVKEAITLYGPSDHSALLVTLEF